MPRRACVSILLLLENLPLTMSTRNSCSQLTAYSSRGASRVKIIIFTYVELALTGTRDLKFNALIFRSPCSPIIQGPREGQGNLLMDESMGF
ncbi:hypothetical protein M758_8G103100 [Ceratodon purpureus]|nr:hypothetical protein M758_8G103100 [Ceratodon purpureus]